MALFVRTAAVLAGAAMLTAAPFLSGPAPAQEAYPSRPVELIVTFGPGGGSDVMGRQIARQLEPLLGVSVPVSNVSGSSGNAGLTRLKTSEPDGYTIGTLISLTVASWASGIGGNAPEEFRVVAIVQSSPSFLFVSQSSPYQTVEALFDHARANPGQLTVATSGYGTQDDVTLQLLAGGGIEMTNVPFEKPAERYASPIGGHTDAIYEEPGDVAQFVESGQMKPLVVFAKERHPEFPDVPTSSELGIDIAGLDNFRTIAVPAGTPEEVVAQLEEALLEVTSSDDWKAFCQQTYTCIEPVTGEAAQEIIVSFRNLIAERLDN